MPPDEKGQSSARPLSANAKNAIQWAANHGAGVIGVAALLVYGVARTGSDAFYGTLGVVPEEVGVSYSVLVSRAALYLVFVVLSLPLFAAILSILLDVRTLPLVRRWHHREGLRNGLTAAAVVLFAITEGFLLFGSQLYFLTWFAYAFVFFWLAVIAEAAYNWPRVGRRGEQVLDYRAIALRLAWVGFATLFVIVVVYRDLALRVRDGVPVGPVRFQPVPIRADAVCLRSVNGPMPLRSAGPFMYLGQADGRIVLFDYKADHFNVIRVPSSSVITEWATPGRERTRIRPPGQWSCPAGRGFRASARR